MSEAHPIFRYMSDDHARIDELLRRSIAAPREINLEAFDAFRRGLLRHIGIEEKILFPAARRALGGDVPGLSRLRADHGRLTALLVASPTQEGIAEIRGVLGPHNEVEEDGGRVYERCIELTLSDSRELLDRIRQAPEVPVRPYQDARRPKLLDSK